MIPALPSSSLSLQRLVQFQPQKSPIPAQSVEPVGRIELTLPAREMLVAPRDLSLVRETNTAVRPPNLTHPQMTIPWMQVLSAIWLAGVFGISLAIAISCAQYRRRIRRLEVSTPKKQIVRALLNQCAQEMAIARPPRLRITSAVDTPALTGFFRHELLVAPQNLDQLSRRELRLVLLHEIAHLRRGDLRVNWLLSLLLALHWFNPLIWWAFHRTRVEAEGACDAMVLRYAGNTESASYGNALLSLLRSRPCPNLVAGVVGVAESTRDLRNRITAIGRFSGQPRVSKWHVALWTETAEALEIPIDVE